MKVSAIEPEEPFSGQTVPIEVEPDKKKGAKIIESSCRLYTARPKKRKNGESRKTVRKNAGKKVKQRAEEKVNKLVQAEAHLP